MAAKKKSGSKRALSDKQVIANLKRRIRTLESEPTKREKHKMDLQKIALAAKNTGYTLSQYQRLSESAVGDQLDRAKKSVIKYKQEVERLRAENLKLRGELRLLKPKMTRNSQNSRS